jgi:hypothetical protein
MAQVFVFNATPNAMVLLLNQHVLTLNLSGVQSSNGYAPQTIAVQRNAASGNPGVAQFASVNNLIVSFPNGTAQTYTIVIDPAQLQINSDLQLYIFFNEVVLVTPTGSAGQTGQAPLQAQAMNVRGTALSASVAKDLLKTS